MKKKNPTQECYKDVIKQTKKTLHQVQSWNPLYTECSIKNSSVLRTRQEFKNASAFLLMPVLSPPLGKSDFWSAPWRESHPHRTLGYPLQLLRPHTLLTSIYSPTLSSWWQMALSTWRPARTLHSESQRFYPPKTLSSRKQEVSLPPTSIFHLKDENKIVPMHRILPWRWTETTHGCYFPQLLLYARVLFCLFVLFFYLVLFFFYW